MPGLTNQMSLDIKGQVSPNIICDFHTPFGYRYIIQNYTPPPDTTKKISELATKHSNNSNMSLFSRTHMMERENSYNFLLSSLHVP